MSKLKRRCPEMQPVWEVAIATSQSIAVIGIFKRALQLFISDLISSASQDVWKVDPSATVQNLLCWNQKTPPEPPSQTKDDFLCRNNNWRSVYTLCDRCIKRDSFTRVERLLRGSYQGNVLLSLDWKRGKRSARWTTRRSPNHTRCYSAECVASACMIEHQDGEKEKL